MTDRYMQFVRQIENGCWIWDGPTTIALRGGVASRPARFLYSLLKGPLPSLCYLKKHCAGENCVNPDHHFLSSSEDRFWMRIEKTHTCWIWKGGKNRGYGQIDVNNKLIYTHRFSWELHYGTIPNGLHVLHSCDNPSCVNPEHLFLGTHKDNMQDMVKKGRKAVILGEMWGHAKLSALDVIHIRELIARGEKQRVIAKDYGVRPATISLIHCRKNWKHI